MGMFPLRNEKASSCVFTLRTGGRALLVSTVGPSLEVGLTPLGVQIAIKNQNRSKSLT